MTQTETRKSEKKQDVPVHILLLIGIFFLLISLNVFTYRAIMRLADIRQDMSKMTEEQAKPVIHLVHGKTAEEAAGNLEAYLQTQGWIKTVVNTTVTHDQEGHYIVVVYIPY